MAGQKNWSEEHGAVRNRDGRHPSGRRACGEWMPVVEHMDGLTRRKTGGAPVTHTAYRRTRDVSVVSIRRNLGIKQSKSHAGFGMQVHQR